jgi:hypothetical protein
LRELTHKEVVRVSWSANYSARSWDGSIRAVALCSLVVIVGAALALMKRPCPSRL